MKFWIEINDDDDIYDIWLVSEKPEDAWCIAEKKSLSAANKFASKLSIALGGLEIRGV